MAPSRPEPQVRVVDVLAGYGNAAVVHGVSLQVGAGEVVLVMGPNGAGKSTLVKAITGQVPLMGGNVYLDGGDISAIREEARAARGVGYVPQVNDVFGRLTVQENLEMGGYRLSKSEAGRRIEEMYEEFPQLKALRHRKASNLSGGERKLAAIARALIARPEVLILDEPTANLAPMIARTILHEVVARLAGQGKSLLLIEQRVALALEVATWGYVLMDGRLRLAASAAELRAMEDLSTLFLGAHAQTWSAGADVAGTAE